MRVYLDNCCFNRPFDNQSSIRIQLETDAKLHVQLMIKEGRIELAWSYILDFENSANPFLEKQLTIQKWRHFSVIDVIENNDVLSNATKFSAKGFKAKDALHLACAIEGGCQYFLTTDDFILRKNSSGMPITILNPVDFIKLI